MASDKSELTKGGMLMPSLSACEQLFHQKYGPVETLGWSPLRRLRHGYYSPADVYEALVSKLVKRGCNWIDVGGGHDIFPENPSLAYDLVARAALVVAVDPSDNVQNNPFVHVRVQSTLEECALPQRFDLATLRMVAEHVERPHAFVAKLAALLEPAGLVVVLTVNRWSPASVASRLIPFQLHHPVKSLLWGGNEEDTFPVHYRMNTRGALRRLFEVHNYKERAFCFLDDLSIFGNFRLLNSCEFAAWSACRAFGVSYPENCLLGVYENEKR